MLTDANGAYLPEPHVTPWAGAKAFFMVLPFIIGGGTFRYESSQTSQQHNVNFSKFGAAWLEENELFIPDDDDDDDDD